jgi:thiosulfate dehydrogenase
MVVPIVLLVSALKKSQMQVVKPYRLLFLITMSTIIIAVVLIVTTRDKQFISKNESISSDNKTGFEWQMPDISQISASESELIRYGRDLIANTSFYLGPKGKIAAITNGMNCQNCHLDAGTKRWGNNYSGVFSTYPKFRERSGTVENIYKRVNDCVERSLNGKRGLDTSSREMQAIEAYIKWLGQNVPKNIKPVGAGIKDLPFPGRSADPVKGQLVYTQNCQRCHGINGGGSLNADSTSYVYPPLWGVHSYTTAAGLFRISRFAGYVKYNMPFDAPHNTDARQLTDEEAWDVAAFVNTQPRPDKNYKKDWPDISGKPIDYPFGPYSDGFSEMQHKYGPFEPIRLLKKQNNNGK